LNRRSQVCEALTGTGVRVAEVVGHDGIAPFTWVRKSGLVFQYLNPKEGNLIFDIDVFASTSQSFANGDDVQLHFNVSARQVGRSGRAPNVAKTVGP
jgi:hypothetical protein